MHSRKYPEAKSKLKVEVPRKVTSRKWKEISLAYLKKAIEGRTGTRIDRKENK